MTAVFIQKKIRNRWDVRQSSQRTACWIRLPAEMQSKPLTSISSCSSSLVDFVGSGCKKTSSFPSISIIGNKSYQQKQSVRNDREKSLSTWYLLTAQVIE